MSAQDLSVAATDTLISPKVKPEGKGAAKRTAGTKSRPPRAAKPRLVRPKGPAKSRSQKNRPKATRNAAPKAKATRRPAAAVRSKAASGQGVRIWSACYVYAGIGGIVSMAIRQIRAGDREKAREIALKTPPGEEFMLTIVPESDEQFLGQVRLKAMSAAENAA